MFRSDLADEGEAIQFYTLAAQHAMKIGDIGSGTIFEQIVIDEEGHKSWLELQLSVSVKSHLVQNMFRVWPLQSEVTYFHIVRDDHQIIEADGAFAETLHTGTEAMKAMTAESRREVAVIFGDALPFDRPMAVATPRAPQAKRLVERRDENGQALS